MNRERSLTSQVLRGLWKLFLLLLWGALRLLEVLAAGFGSLVKACIK